MIGDAASVILDNYGQPDTGAENRPIDIASWKDKELMTSYELVRYHDPTAEGLRTPDQVELDIVECYPNGEKSHKRYAIQPSRGVHSTMFILMTAAQRTRYEERLSRAWVQPNGIKVLPPEKDDLEPEHEAELLLGVIAKGLELLENDGA